MSALPEELEPYAPGAEEPGPVVRLLARHPVGFLVTAVLVMSGVWQATVYAGGWFGGDDFVYQSRAIRDGLSADYLDVNYFGQFMPGGFVLAWAEAQLSPLGWSLAVTVTVALHVLAGWTFWRLLRTVLAPSRLLVLPLVLYVTSPLTVPASNWWAASLNTLPLLVVMPLALTSHVHLLRTGRQGHGAVAVAWVAVGLLFTVKAVLLLPLLLLLSRALGHALGLRLSVRRVMRAARLEQALGALLLTGYGAVYLSAPREASASGVQVPHRLPDLLSLFQNGIGHVLLPGIAGGPWLWFPTGAPTALSDVPFLAMVLSWVVVGLVVLAALRLRPSTAGAWLAVLLWACADLAFVALGRLNQFTSGVALESHYVADAVPLVWLAVALSFCRRRGDGGEAPWWRIGLPHRVTAYGGQLAVGLTVAAAVSAVLSVHDFTTERLSRQPARTYVETAARELHHLPPDVRLVDEQVPPTLLDGLFLGEARESNVLLPVTPVARRSSLYPAYAENPMAFDASGHLHRTRVVGVELRKGPQDCGWLVQGTTVSLPWSSTLFDYDWYVRVGYLSAGDTAVTWSFGRTALTTALHRGLGAVTFRVTGQGAVLTVSVPAGASVCIGDAQIGNLQLVP